MDGSASQGKFPSFCKKRFKDLIFILISILFIGLNSSGFSGQANYTYDDLGRLTSVQFADGYTITTIGYEYDDTGNIEGKQVDTEIQDTDGDQLPDAWEALYGLDPDDPSDAVTDSDGDGLTNLEEYEYETDPTVADSDGDGYTDGEEIVFGSDPLDISSHPPAEPVPAVGPAGMIILFLMLTGLFFFRKRGAGPHHLTALFIGVCLSLAAGAHAHENNPGWINARAGLISPDEANSYYQSIQKVTPQDTTEETQAGAAQVTDEIAELARALQHDPILMYEYVRNHVDYVPYFGSLKGATLTFLDGSGNDFDQASLLIALLRESGYTAQYVYGQMAIPSFGDSDHKDMQYWLGTSANSYVISTILAYAGIPATCSSFYHTVSRVWVQAVISGTTYLMDPAFKPYTETSGIDLQTAMAYDQNAFLSAAGGTLDDDSIQNMDEEGLQSALNSYTLNLVEHIRGNYPNASMDEIIGGREIVPEYLDELPTSLDHSVTVEETWTDIPDTHAHTVRIQHGGIDKTLNMATLSGQRLSITYQDEDETETDSVTQVAGTEVSLSLLTQSAAGQTIDTSNLTTQENSDPALSNRQVTLSTSTDDIVSIMSTDQGSWAAYSKVTQSGYCDRGYTFSNPIEVAVTLTVSLTSNPSGAFSITSGSGTTSLAVGASTNVIVRLSGSGQTAGSKTGTLRMLWKYGSLTLADYTYSLSGEVAKEISLGGYGMRAVAYLNKPVTGTCRLINNGNEALTINSMSLSGDNPGRFQFVSGNSSGTITAGGYRDIQVSYLASAHGSHDAVISMSLTYDDITYSGDVLSLEGITYYTPDLDESYGLNFGEHYTGDTVEGACILKNTGNLSLTITAVSLIGDDPEQFEIVSGDGSGSLSSGSSREIVVNYLAGSDGSHNAKVAISYTYDGYSYTGDARYTLPLTGETLATPAAQLWLDDELIAEETTPVSGSDLGTMTLTIDHPYSAASDEDDESGTFGDQSVEYTLKRDANAAYALIYGFGGSGRGKLLEKRSAKLQTYRNAGYADDSRQVLTEALNVMGMTWMRDTTLNETMLGQIAGITSIRHHRIGVVAQESGYYIDVKAQVTSSASTTGDTAATQAFFKAINHLASAMEHGVLEQMQVDQPSVSTVKLLQITNDEGGKVFYVTSDNFSTLETELSGYSDEDLTEFETFVGDGGILILPANPGIALEEWAGKGYIEYKESGTSRHCGMIIGGDYYGGYSALQTYLDIGIQTSYVDLSTFDEITDLNLAAGEPVDMVTGAWMHDHTDLILSGGMGGLNLSRSYYSANNNILGPMGYGWSHSYDLYAEVHSNSEFGLGRRTPVDAAALITASVVTLDLMTGDPDLKDWMAGALTGKWAMDQLTDNAVSVHLGTDVLTYIKLPDGSFGLPPGITSELSTVDGLYRINERFDRTVSFNSDNRVSAITDADGNTITFAYSDGKLQSVADDFGHSLSFSYSGDLVSSVADSAGRTVSYGYSGSDLISATDAEGKVWAYGYDGEHRVLTLTDPMSVTTVTNVYNSLGRVESQAVPRQGATADYQFYFSGCRNAEQDPNGRLTVYHFDDRKRLTGVEDALGNRSKNTYDGQDHVIAATGPRGFAATHEYDGNNNLIRTTDALSGEIVNTYDEDHHLIQVADPLGNTVSYQYDGEHHLVKTTISPSSGETIETSASYFTNGLTQTRTDGRGVVTTLAYDSYGNPATSRTASAPAITYTYSGTGQMTSLTDQGGSQTAFVYDNRGLVQTRTDPLLKTTSMDYYDDGKLYTTTDRNGDTTTLTYTPSGKPAAVTYQDGTSVAFTYDLHDNLTGMQDSQGSTAYSYDEVNRLVSSTDPNGFTVAYEYDEAGNLVKLIYPDSKTVTYTYDALDRLETVTIDWLGLTAAYEYDLAGNLTGLTQFNGTYASFGYDNANRLIELKHLSSASGSAFASFAFTLDGNGNRTGIDWETPLSPSMESLTTAFEVSAAGNRIVTAGDDSLTYDDEGQLLTKGEDTFTFDPAHRLTAAATGTDSLAFSYDGAGNRLSVDRNGTITRYVYDAAGNLLAEADTSGITRYYIHGAGLLAMVTSGGTPYCYHFDATGHTIALTDADQTVVNKYAYTPFGVPAGEEETVTQPFKFVGQFGVMTEDNGWYYMRARYYDPDMGRFICEDPLGFDGGDVNLYVYCLNNPVMFIDPNGEVLQSVIAGGIAGGIVGGINFVTDFMKTQSISSATKAAIISGTTTAVTVGLATSGIGTLVSGAAGSATNAALQKMLNGEINIASAVYSGYAVSAGALATTATSVTMPSVAQGVFSGLVGAPVNELGNVIFK